MLYCSYPHFSIWSRIICITAPPHYKAQSIITYCIQFSYPFSLLGRWHCWGTPTPPRPLFFRKISSIWVCLMFLHGDISAPQSWLQCRPWERGDTSRPCRYPPRHQNNPRVEQLPARLPQPSFMGGLQRCQLTAPFLFPITGSESVSRLRALLPPSPSLCVLCYVNTWIPISSVQNLLLPLTLVLWYLAGESPSQLGLGPCNTPLHIFSTFLLSHIARCSSLISGLQ